MVHRKKIWAPEAEGNKRVFDTNSFFIFDVNTTFWKNDRSTIYDQTGPKLFSLVLNTVMSTGIKNMFDYFVQFFLRVFDLFKLQCMVIPKGMQGSLGLVTHLFK